MYSLNSSSQILGLVAYYSENVNGQYIKIHKYECDLTLLTKYFTACINLNI